MQNPLAMLLAVADRSDGVYITIPRDKKGIPSCDAIFKLLDAAQATNYNKILIEEVYNRARGAPEKIGPPFEYYNKAIEQFITVTISDSNATVLVNPDINSIQEALTPTMLCFCLKEKGILFGIIPENVTRVIEEGMYNCEIIIAQGKEPVDGKDAFTKLEVQNVIDHKPQARFDGSVDFRKIHSFTQVNEGQILARKIPATTGTCGQKVTGETIPCKPGNDIPLQPGKNTQLSEDGLSIVASRTGLLQISGSQVSVLEQLVIQKDVDFSVGNIRYSGELLIKGNVKPGFSVEAEGDIEILGLVESASIKSRNGSVTIKKGVLGKSDAFIFAKSQIDVLFAQEATLETEGSINIERHCLHCECVCSIFNASTPQSTVIGGTIKASSHILATQIGNTKGIDTHIVLFDVKKGIEKAKLNEYLDLKTKIVTSLEPIKKQVSTKAAIFKKAADLVTENQKAEMKKWIDSYNMLNVKLKYVQEKIDEITKAIDSPSSYEGYVKVTDGIFPGSILELYGKRKIINLRSGTKIFKIDKNGEITSE